MTRVFSVGIGLTNEGALRCPHCYRSDMVLARLTRGDVGRVCDSVKAEKGFSSRFCPSAARSVTVAEICARRPHRDSVEKSRIAPSSCGMPSGRA